MRYLTLLWGDPSHSAPPGTPESDAELAEYGAFGEVAGPAIIGGEALIPTPVTVRAGDTGPLVTAGPFAETTEVIGGFYVLEAGSDDEVAALAAQIPAAKGGAIEVRPVVDWQAAPGTGADRWMALIWGKETPEDRPGTPEWEQAAVEHGRFAEAAGGAVLGGTALQPSETAFTVRRGANGEALVTAGPFAETAEVIGGVYLLKAATSDEAAALAARIPVNPGGAIELAPIMVWD
jgi:hypothetical protein